MTRHMTRIAVIGGGYTGTAFAVHLSRTTKTPLDIVVVESREQVGGGLAHSAVDPDHRLNAPDTIHPLYSDDPLHFRHWLETTGRLAADPQAWYSDNRLYPRRGDFGAYLTAQFADHARANPSSSSLAHRRDTATAIDVQDGALRIELAKGDTLLADRCAITLGQESTPAPIAGLEPSASDRRLIGDPWAPEALTAIDRDTAVLILGTGLTAADVVASLVGRGHRGAITCISRHGVRPQQQNPVPAAGPLWDRLAIQPPTFIEAHGALTSLRDLVRSVRQDARDLAAQGQPWHKSIDAVRDAAGEIWCALPVAEKRRFFRHVRSYYDGHRFRITPQTRDILVAAEARGQLTFHIGRVIRAEARGEGLSVVVQRRGEATTETQAYGAIISCAGFSTRVDESHNPFARSCLQRGLARPSDMGRGFDTDEDCRALSALQGADSGLYVLGSLTLDRFGETPAAIFILRQIIRMLPRFVESL